MEIDSFRDVWGTGWLDVMGALSVGKSQTTLKMLSEGPRIWHVGDNGLGRGYTEEEEMTSGAPFLVNISRSEVTYGRSYNRGIAKGVYYALGKGKGTRSGGAFSRKKT